MAYVGAGHHCPPSRRHVRSPVGCHVLRPWFATQLLKGRYDIRTIQDLLGHRDVGTTMIYTHVLTAAGLGCGAPLPGWCTATAVVRARDRGLGALIGEVWAGR